MLRPVPLTGEFAQLIPGGRWGLGMVRRPLPCGGHVWTVAGRGAGSETYVSSTEDGGTNVVVHSTGTGDPARIRRGTAAHLRLMDDVLCAAVG